MTSTAGELIRRWVGEDFAVGLASIELVDHGLDRAAERWRGSSAGGADYSIKLSGGGSAAGLVVSDHLARQPVPGIPGPVRTNEGLPWSKRAGRRLSVVPWVSDRRALSGGMNPKQWSAFGALLAAVHRTPITATLAELLPREDHVHDEAAAAVRDLDRQLRAPAEIPADPFAGRLAELWRSVAPELARLLELADQLGQQLRDRPARYVVCHGDPHLGNVLLDGDHGVWLIDWDDAILAPPERDLMFVTGGGVLAVAPVGTLDQVRFFDGYGAIEPDPARLAYYQCVRAVVDVTDPAAQVLDSAGHTEADRADALEIVTGVLSPTGLVAVALTAVRDLGSKAP